jgi:UDP-GlcNAc:undecaprenyl-phosphate GlcNAc-1-phosphate transferase
VLLVLVDDRWGIDALTKLGRSGGLGRRDGAARLQIPHPHPPGIGAVSLGPESVLLTVLLALLTINAVNFIDGLDGLAAGVGAIAALAFFVFSYSLSSGQITSGLEQERISAPTLIAVVLAGACLGSCRTTSTPPASSWATPGRCSSACCWPAPPRA